MLAELAQRSADPTAQAPQQVPEGPEAAALSAALGGPARAERGHDARVAQTRLGVEDGVVVVHRDHRRPEGALSHSTRSLATLGTGAQARRGGKGGGGGRGSWRGPRYGARQLGTAVAWLASAWLNTLTR